MTDQGSTSPHYSARPVLALDGTREATLEHRLLSLMIDENTDGLFRCEATFGNWGAVSGDVGFLYFNRSTLEFGRSITVELGDGNAAAEVFDGRITGIEGRFPTHKPPEILVLAEDRLQDLRMTRRSRSFEVVTLDDVVQQIASDHGLQADVDIDSPSYAILVQVNQSDLAFLRERARDVDAEVWVDGRELHVQARSRRSRTDVTLGYASRLHEFQVLADLACQRTSVAVSGWDVGNKEAISRSGDSAALQGEIEGDSGGSLLQQAFGQRADRVVHLSPLSSDEAESLAKAHYNRLARRFVQGKAVCEGDGRIRVGTRVTLEGLGGLFNGTYYVTEVTHTFDTESGYLTRFSVERPWLGSGGLS